MEGAGRTEPRDRRSDPRLDPRRGGVRLTRHFVPARREPLRRGGVGASAPPSSRARAARPSSSSATSRCRARGRSSPPTSSSSKYFRGPLGTPQRERSVRQLIGRVVDTIARLGRRRRATSRRRRTGGPSPTSSPTCCCSRRLSFNSPVWFNVGVEPKPQCSACFILSVDDTMDSILDWYRKEGVIFKGGSGSGVNLSRHPLVARSGSAAAARPRGRCRSCARPTRRRA